MTGVFYFPRYSQRENFATNNTLLLMYQLYDRSRRRFQDFLAKLLDAKADAPIAAIGLQILQQEPGPTSVPDGYLYQSPVRIALEAKRSATAFDVDQLLNHLDRFEDGGSGYLLLLSPNEVSLDGSQWLSLHEKAGRKGVVPASVSFQKIIECFRECLKDHDEDLHDLVDDFETFCSGERLLNTDETTIFIPPCGQSFSINERQKLYFCPSAWSRRNVRFLGIYKDKSVRYLGEILKIARYEVGAQPEFEAHDTHGNPVDLTSEEAERIRATIPEAGEKGWDISKGHKFYLCDELVETDFRKTTSGGIMGHRYIDLYGYFKPSSMPKMIDDLAEQLRHQTWT